MTLMYNRYAGREQAIRTWLGRRIFRLFGGRPDADRSPWAAIVMSHRHRHPEAHSEWRLAIEKSLVECRESQSFLLASMDTPMGPYLIQAAQRFQVPVIQLCQPHAGESYRKWEQRLLNQQRYFALQSNPNSIQLWLSPFMELSTTDSESEENQANGDGLQPFEPYPLVDRALIALADKLRVITVAPASKTEWLLQQRLDNKQFPTASVFIALNASFDRKSKFKVTKPNIATKQIENLLDRGAVGWFYESSVELSTDNHQLSSTEQVCDDDSIAVENSLRTWVPFFKPRRQQSSSTEPWPYLTHCTRARTGAWPDQSRTGYYDSVLATSRNVDLQASAFDTLKRILFQQRLISSSDLNRSGVPTISFTEVELSTLLPRRHFQSHLGRWDWEPYGICINRRWIENKGGRRVIYLNDAHWKELALQDRPFFQPIRDADTPNGMDWESEQEWRMVGDIHLAEIPFEAAFVFVSTTKEAKELSRLSRFAIMVVD